MTNEDEVIGRAAALEGFGPIRIEFSQYCDTGVKSGTSNWPGMCSFPEGDNPIKKRQECRSEWYVWVVS